MEMVRQSGQQGVPVIKVDNEYIVGFDRPRIEQALRAAPARPPSFGAGVADAALRTGGATNGAYVGRVRAGSAAQRAGLQVGDIVTALNGRPVETAADLERHIRPLHSGDDVRVRFVRGDQAHTGSAPL